MNSSMDTFFECLESENSSLTIQVNSLQSEQINLSQQVVGLEKALEKQQNFHRKYVEDVAVTEKLRIDDFKQEKRSLTEQNKGLTNKNRQLMKELDFYKMAYEEVSKENGNIAFYKNAYEELIKKRQVPYTATRTPRTTSFPPVAISRSDLRSPSHTPPTVPATSLTTSTTLGSSKCGHKSSKVLSQLSEKLLIDNKKLKNKLDNQSATNQILKVQNKKLEAFKKKIDNKKLQFRQDSDELKKLVDLTESKNKTTFSAEVLAKLGDLSMYKIK